MPINQTESIINTSVSYIENILYSELLSKVIVAVVLMLFGLIIGRIVGRVMRRVMHELEIDKALRKAGIRISFKNIISHFSEYFVYFVFLVIVLNYLKVGRTIVNVIAFGAVAVLIISAIIAIKDFVPNFLSGLYIYQKRKIREGDYLFFENVEGTVLDVTLTEVKIKTKSGDFLYIPNNLLNKTKIRISRKKP